MIVTVGSVLARPEVVPATIPVAAVAPVHVAAPVHLAAPVNIVAPASVVAPAAVVEPEPPVGVAHVPAQVGTAISKTVHYAETPVVTGYTSTLYKSDLSAFDMPFKFNHHQRYLRPVSTLVPRLVQVESNAHSNNNGWPFVATGVRETNILPAKLFSAAVV